MTDFPRMIYHVVDAPVIVYDKVELDDYLEKGWSLTPVLFDEIKALQAKIAHHKSEAARLTKVLDELMSEDEQMREAQKENKIICAKCGYEAKSNAGLAAHQKKHKYEQEPENETVLENSSK